ncbi:MAG: Uma2 family endonuclease [Firmicutes bacterium]|nr:Uma2 family endonuclease [Bacillota bacterium]
MSGFGDEYVEPAETIHEEEPRYYSANRVYTYSDYLQLPAEECYYYEILDGTLIKEPAPTKLHQRVSRRLQRILEDYFWQRDPQAEIFNSPIDLVLSETNVIQPDLVYAPEDSDDICEHGITVIPQLIVEVISPSTERKDRFKKLGIYSRAGVSHYWIVDPKQQTLKSFRLVKPGEYVLYRSAEGDEVFTHPDFPGLAIHLDVLWRKGRL